MGTATRLIAGLMLIAGAAGCEKTIVLERVPAFWGPKIRVVAVAPFNNRSSRPQAAELVPQRLAERLMASRSYEKVIGPAELMERLRASDMTLPTDDPAAIAQTVGQLVPGIDAVIIGTVEAWDYDQMAYVDIDNFHNYSLYPYRGLPTYSGYTYYYPGLVVYNSEVVRLAATASMVSVPDGTVLIKTSRLVGDQRVSPGKRPEDVHAKLVDSCDAAGKQLATTFMKAPVKVKVHPDRVVRTARVEPQTGRLFYTDDFDKTDKEVIVVIDLPSEAVRNDFCVTITPRRSDHVLVEQEFTWGPTDVNRRLIIHTAELTEKTPATDFWVHLYAIDDHRRLLITREFEIER